MSPLSLRSSLQKASKMFPRGVKKKNLSLATTGSQVMNRSRWFHSFSFSSFFLLPSSVSWGLHCLFPRVPMTCPQTGTRSASCHFVSFILPGPGCCDGELIASQRTTLFRISSFMKRYFRLRDFVFLPLHSLMHFVIHLHHRSLNRCR